MYPPGGEETPCCNKVSSAPPPSPSPAELAGTPPPRAPIPARAVGGEEARVRPAGPMDSAAVITQISKEEARGPLRGKGIGALQGGEARRGEAAMGVSGCGGAKARSPELVALRGARLGWERRVWGTGGDAGRGLALLRALRSARVGKLRLGLRGVLPPKLPGGWGVRPERRPLPRPTWRQRGWERCQGGVRRVFGGHPLQLRPPLPPRRGRRGDSGLGCGGSPPANTGRVPPPTNFRARTLGGAGPLRGAPKVHPSHLGRPRGDWGAGTLARSGLESQSLGPAAAGHSGARVRGLLHPVGA